MLLVGRRLALSHLLRLSGFRWRSDVYGRDANQPVVAVVNIDRCDVALLPTPTPFYDHAGVFAEHIHSFNRIEMIGGMPFLEHVAVPFFKRFVDRKPVRLVLPQPHPA